MLSAALVRKLCAKNLASARSLFGSKHGSTSNRRRPEAAAQSSSMDTAQQQRLPQPAPAGGACSSTRQRAQPASADAVWR